MPKTFVREIGVSCPIVNGRAVTSNAGIQEFSLHVGKRWVIREQRVMLCTVQMMGYRDMFLNWYGDCEL